MIYMCTSRGYRYRVRGWVVNVQWLVEDVFERRMRMEDECLHNLQSDGDSLLGSQTKS